MDENKDVLESFYRELGLDEIEKDKYAVLSLRRAAKQKNPSAMMMVALIDAYQKSMNK